MRAIQIAALLLALPCAARAADDAAARAERWHDLQHAIFGDRIVQDGALVLRLEAPPRAMDAALVPVSITITGPQQITGIYLLIDDNPAPVAAHISFFPLADPHHVDLRVRVDQYTNIHALAEASDGRLYAVAAFVKAAGGCSAPAGDSTQAALQSMGQMKLRPRGAFVAGKALQVELLIRHPNFNGMQMDQVTRYYTPARYINATDVSFNGAKVLHVDSDISLSSDPAITFSFVPPDRGTLQVTARDSKNTVFHHDFPLPAAGS